MSDDFCLIHGYEHMRRNSIFDKVPYCAECERERAAEPRFLTQWEREDYEREKRGEPPLGPLRTGRWPLDPLDEDTMHNIDMRRAKRG